MDAKLESLHALVRSAKNEIEDIRASGRLPDEVYYKCLVCLAYEYASHKYIEEVVALITQIPTEYFGPISTKQMEEDYSFKVCAEAVAQVLVNAGYLRAVITKKKDTSNVN